MRTMKITCDKCGVSISDGFWSVRFDQNAGFWHDVGTTHEAFDICNRCGYKAYEAFRLTLTNLTTAERAFIWQE